MANSLAADESSSSSAAHCFTTMAIGVNAASDDTKVQQSPQIDLSQRDLAQMKSFSQSKTRIDAYIQRLRALPVADPFADFAEVRAGALRLEEVREVWETLEERCSIAAERQDVCDDIQDNVSQLETSDIEHLRSLTKAAIGHNLSADDTDLIELAMHTLGAFDTLARLLIAERRYLLILHARLDWEVQRKRCWTKYLGLRRDLDAFITLSSRFSTMRGGSKDEGEESTKNASASPNTQKHAAFLQIEAAELARRCHALLSQELPSADRLLNELMDQRQVPDALLDEQDRLDDFSELIKEKLIVITRLSRQWKWADRADELTKLLDRLNANTTVSQRSEKIPVIATQSVIGVMPDVLMESEKSPTKLADKIDKSDDSHTSSSLSISAGSQSISLDLSTPRKALSIPEEHTPKDGHLTIPVQSSPAPPECQDLSDLQVSSTNVQAMESNHHASLLSVAASSASNPDATDAQVQRPESVVEVIPIADTMHSPAKVLPAASLDSSRVEEKADDDVFAPAAVTAPPTKRSMSSLPASSSSASITRSMAPPSLVTSKGPVFKEVAPVSYLPRVRQTVVNTPTRPAPTRTPQTARAKTPIKASQNQRHASTPTRSVIDESRLSPVASRAASLQLRQRLTSNSFAKGPNRYRANPKSKLDVAVGKIINDMAIPIAIAHAASAKAPNRSSSPGSASSSGRNSVSGSRAEQWHDESGRYWLGYPDPKLCFCRILRSKTVMVRVGGGWEELSGYIDKHYAHLATNESVSVTTSPIQSPTKDGDLPWLSAATLMRTPTKSVRAQTPSVSGSIGTPDFTSLSLMPSMNSNTTLSASSSISFPSPSQSTTVFSSMSDFNEGSLSPDRMRKLWMRKDKQFDDGDAFGTRISTSPKSSRQQGERKLSESKRKTSTIQRSRVLSNVN